MLLLLEVMERSSELLGGFGETTQSHWSVSIAIPRGLMVSFALFYQVKLKISSIVFMIIVFDIFFGHGSGLNFVVQQDPSRQ